MSQFHGKHKRFSFIDVFTDVICNYNKTKCLWPSLLVGVSLFVNIGAYATTTAGTIPSNLKFTTSVEHKENSFGTVKQEKIPSKQNH